MIGVVGTLNKVTPAFSDFNSRTMVEACLTCTFDFEASQPDTATANVINQRVVIHEQLVKI